MSDLADLIQNDEKVLYVGRYHWLYSFQALLALIFLGWTGIGLWWFAQRMMMRLSTIVAVTERRVIFRRGIIARRVDEINIDRIEGCIVYQSIIGRCFNYGMVVVRGTGIGEVTLPEFICDPMHLRNAIDTARERFTEQFIPAMGVNR